MDLNLPPVEGGLENRNAPAGAVVIARSNAVYYRPLSLSTS